MPRLLSAGLVAAAFVLFVTVPPGSVAAQEAQVTAGEERFTPPTLTIPVGGSVSWRITEGIHTITAEDGSFDSEDRTVGEVFTVQFNRRGQFAYYCKWDRHLGMTGVVMVGGATPTTTTTRPPSAGGAGNNPPATQPPPASPPPTAATTSTSTTTTTEQVPIDAWLSPIPTTPPATSAPPEDLPRVDPEEGAVTAVLEDEPRRNNTGLLIAAGLGGVALLGGAGTYAWFRRPSRYLPA